MTAPPTALRVAAALALTSALGFGLGRMSAPSHRQATDRRAQQATAVATTHQSSTSRSRQVQAPGPAMPSNGSPSQSLAELAEPLRWSRDPVALVASIIDEMSHDELALAVATVTRRDRSELDGKRDLHAFATALAEAAMSGVVSEPRRKEAEAVAFATELADAGASFDGDEVLPAGARRIFGLFPLEEGAARQVIAKWYRVDQPELLLFQELPVRERNGRGFVRFDRAAGWPEGEYRLEIYDVDDRANASGTLELIASGDYRTTGTGPRTVVFR